MEELLICPIHDVEFFMRGKMKAHAHPMEEIDGSKDWCNRHDVVKLVEAGKISVPPLVPAPVPEPEPEPVPAVSTIIDSVDDSDAQALAAKNGLDWEIFKMDVLSGNTWEQFVNMGGTLEIAEKRIKLMYEGASS